MEGTLLAPSDDGTTDYRDFGTGFIVSADGLVLTAGHLFPSANKFEGAQYWISVQIPSYNKGRMSLSNETIQARLLRASQFPSDTAILRINSQNRRFPFLRMCDEYSSETRLSILGYGGGEDYVAKVDGTVRAHDDGINPADLQIPSNRGDSGAPVFNEHGSVFAISIGQHIVNDVPIINSALAVPIPIAVTNLSPDARTLLGLSYFPDCDQIIPSQTTTVDLKIDQLVRGNAHSSLSFTPPPNSVFTGAYHLPQLNGSNLRSGSLENIQVSPDRFTGTIHAVTNSLPGGIQGRSAESTLAGTIVAETKLPSPEVVTEERTAQIQSVLITLSKVPSDVASEDPSGIFSEDPSGIVSEAPSDAISEAPSDGDFDSIDYAASVIAPPHMKITELLNVRYNSRVDSAAVNPIDARMKWPSIESKLDGGRLYLSTSLGKMPDQDMPDQINVFATLQLVPVNR